MTHNCELDTKCHSSSSKPVEQSASFDSDIFFPSYEKSDGKMEKQEKEIEKKKNEKRKKRNKEIYNEANPYFSVVFMQANLMFYVCCHFEMLLTLFTMLPFRLTFSFICAYFAPVACKLVSCLDVHAKRTTYSEQNWTENSSTLTTLSLSFCSSKRIGYTYVGRNEKRNIKKKIKRNRQHQTTKRCMQNNNKMKNKWTKIGQKNIKKNEHEKKRTKLTLPLMIRGEAVVDFISFIQFYLFVYFLSLFLYVFFCRFPFALFTSSFFPHFPDHMRHNRNKYPQFNGK